MADVRHTHGRLVAEIEAILVQNVTTLRQRGGETEAVGFSFASAAEKVVEMLCEKTVDALLPEPGRSLQ